MGPRYLDIWRNGRGFNPALPAMCHACPMPASPLTFVPVFMGVALHIAGSAAPDAPDTRCFTAAPGDDRAAAMTQAAPCEVAPEVTRRRFDPVWPGGDAGP